MRNGTQEELDLATEDARLLPFDALFKIVDNNNSSRFDIGDVVYRSKQEHGNAADSVLFCQDGRDDIWFFSASRLGVVNG